MIDKKPSLSEDFHEKIILQTQNQEVIDSNFLPKKQPLTSLENGSLIPNLPIKTIFGETSLHKYKTNNLVIFFYPKDNTSGCTIECEDFSKLHSKFLQSNTQVVGVSRDSIKSHEKFFKKFNLSINLIADENEKLCLLFDVIKQKNLYGKKVKGIERSTFFIDSYFFLKKSWRGVKAKGHAEQVLKDVNSYFKNQSQKNS